MLYLIMGNKKPYYLEKCRKLAERSDLLHKHGALLVKNGSILGYGNNRYGKKKGIYKHSLHAEFSCISKSLLIYNLHEISNSTLYVVRVNNSGEFKLSAPCNKCIETMIK